MFFAAGEAQGGGGDFRGDGGVGRGAGAVDGFDFGGVRGGGVDGAGADAGCCWPEREKAEAGEGRHGGGGLFFVVVVLGGAVARREERSDIFFDRGRDQKTIGARTAVIDRRGAWVTGVSAACDIICLCSSTSSVSQHRQDDSEHVARCFCSQLIVLEIYGMARYSI